MPTRSTDLVPSRPGFDRVACGWCGCDPGDCNHVLCESCGQPEGDDRPLDRARWCAVCLRGLGCDLDELDPDFVARLPPAILELFHA